MYVTAPVFSGAFMQASKMYYYTSMHGRLYNRDVHDQCSDTF